MAYKFIIAAVFTDRPFGGNQLAVIPDGQGLSDRAVQAITREFTFAGSTFVFPAKEETNTARLRIFSPASEAPYAGHPTVGTAAVLAGLGVINMSAGPATPCSRRASALWTSRLTNATVASSASSS